MGGGGGKGGKGGGSSGSVDVDVSSNSVSTIDADSTSNITANSRNELSSTSNNQIDSNATAQLQMVGLDNIRLKADTTSDSRTQLDFDLKPLQVDLCLKLGLERFPSTRICRPTNRRLGFTLFGVEIVGISYSSEQKTIIEDMRNRPFVVSDVPGGGGGDGHERGGIKLRLNE